MRALGPSPFPRDSWQLSSEVIERDWEVNTLRPIVNAKDADEIRGVEAEKNPPLTDPQAQFTGTVFEGLYIRVTCRGVTYQGRINPCLDDAVKACDRAPRQDGTPRGGSQPEPAPNFLQGNIVARFREGQIQLGRSFGVDDFLRTWFRKKGNGRLYVSVRKGIYERVEAIAVGGHA